MSKILSSVIVALWMLVMITGCTPIMNKYHVTVDAIAAPEATSHPSSYVIQPLDGSAQSSDLHFQRQSQHLIKLLNRQGYTQATHAHLAETLVYFDYGLEKVQEERRIYREPEVSFGISWGFPYGYYHRRYHPFWHDVGYTTYRTYERRHVLYNRYIVIVAKDQLGKELWRVDVSSVGESNNLAKIVPLLIDASAPYLGTDTQEPIQLSIAEKPNKTE